MRRAGEGVPRIRERPRFSGQAAALVDSACWFAGIVLAVALRYDFLLSRVSWGGVLLLVLGTTAIQYLVGTLLHIYTGRFLAAAFEEFKALGASFAITALVSWSATLVAGPRLGVPRSVMLIAFPISLVLAMVVRSWVRGASEKHHHPGPQATPTLILGGGFVGQRLVRWMASDSLSAYVPVGILDDDPSKKNLYVRDVPVLGSLSDLGSVAAKTGAEVLVVAVAEAPASLMRKVQDEARKAGLAVKVMPPMAEVVAHGVRGADLRDLSAEDLLGRAVVDTNVSEIAGYLTGKRVLVTGAGGSIGSQLCVEISKFGPRELIMLDRDETGLQAVQIGTTGSGLLDTDDVVLADIRDAETLKQIFADRRPDVVFHAAALKHLPMLEQYPDEAWQTNVIGTLNVLRAAQAAGVGTFVNISTDKAANPTSILGYSKRAAEKLTSHVGSECGQRYISVRFGNVIGSRGSMLPTFQRLIEEGKPLTITHPDITRYFMTIPEACQLVLQAGGIGSTGEVLILDMGEPVKILDIARRMIAMSGKQIEVVFTGLREGEKLHEELVGTGETEVRPYHPKISHARVDPLNPRDLDKGQWDVTVQSRDVKAGHGRPTAAVRGVVDAQTVPIRLPLQSEPEGPGEDRNEGATA